MANCTVLPTEVLAANESGINLFGRWDSADVEVKDMFVHHKQNDNQMKKCS
jgi:hypothetical protein